MLKILLAGSDLHLLETRAAVLSKTGAVVAWCSADDAHEFLDREKFDLLVLCHSLSQSEIETLKDRVHREFPEMKILLVASYFDENAIRQNGQGGVMIRPDPERLVTQVKELLESVPHVASTRLTL
jgi:CheY-like chemotaxis protein